MKLLTLTLVVFILLAGCDQNGSPAPPAVRLSTTAQIEGPVKISDIHKEKTSHLHTTPGKEAHFTPDISERTLFMVNLPGKNYKIALSLGMDEVIDLKLADRYPMGFRVEGSEESERLAAFNKALYRAERRMQQHMQDIYSRKEDFSDIRKEAMKAMEASRDSLQALARELIEEDYGALANTILLQQYFAEEKLLPIARFPELHRKVMQQLRNQEGSNARPFIKKTTQALQSIKQLKEARERTSAGATAPDIRLPAPDGTMLSLHSITQKPTVLLFWSLDDQNIRNVFSQIKELEHTKKDAFDVFAISLHENTRLWKRTAQALPQWYHVSEPRQFAASSAKRYGLETTPVFFLINAQKKILLRTTAVDTLMKKLESNR